MEKTSHKYCFLLLVLIHVFLCSGLALYAASNRVDSLRRELYRQDEVAGKIRLYLAISKEYTTINPDSAALAWKMAQKLALGLNDPVPLGDVYAMAASNALTGNNLDQAFLNATLAAKYYQQAGDYRQLVWMKSILGGICQVQDNVAGAMSYYVELIALSEEHHLVKILPHALNNVGNIYMDAGEFNEGLAYYTRALKIFKESKDSASVVFPIINMGECYYYLDNLELATDYIKQTLALASRSGDNIIQARGFMLMGMIRSRQGDLPNAIADMYHSLELHKESGTYFGPSEIQYTELVVTLGKTLSQAEDMINARRYLWEGYALASSLKQVRQAMLASQTLSQIYEKSGRLDSALFYFKISRTHADSLSKSGTVRTVRLMEVRQDYERKQKENEIKVALARSSKRTVMILYISSGIVLLAVIVILFLMLKLERQRKAKSELEKSGLHEKLEYQNKELTTNVMYLTRMNEMVMMVAEKLRSLRLDDQDANARTVQSLINELERTSNPDNWKEFETRFQQVHTDFYRKLGEKFPDLTPNELKLCAFLRLNMSTKEISSITYQSQNSIQVARFRLRQKLGITKDENLVIFLSQF